MECRSQGRAGSDQPGAYPGSGLSRFSGARENSRCSLRGSVQGVSKVPAWWARHHMNLYCGEQCAFASFSNQLGALKEDDSQRLATACEAERWAPKQKECTPAPSPRAYKEYARHFVTIHVDEFRTSCIHYELGCPLQRDEMEKCHRGSEDTEKYGPLTEGRMERRAKVRGLVAFVSRNSGEKGVECVNRDFNAAMYIRRCAVPEKRPEQLTRAIVVWQPLKIEVYRGT